MSGHANFILPNGTWLGANDSSTWEIHTTAELRQGQQQQQQQQKTLIGSARTACLDFNYENIQN